MVELAEKSDLHATQIARWRAHLIEAYMDVFCLPAEKRENTGPSVKDMQAKK